jgi:hypothetical protein
MEYHPVADGDLIADDQRMGVVGDMEHAEILHVGSISNPNMVHVPANDGMEPHAAVLAQYHIADDNAGLFDKAGDGNGWFDALKCADHAAHCRGIGRQSARGGAVRREIAPRRLPREASLDKLGTP